jgi:predicted 3-demethylubiquinone-9 3-methyltransferase (glyoxalase superfamily)
MAIKSTTPFLWFEQGAGAAADFYAEVFDDVTILSKMPGPGEEPMGVTLSINGATVTLFNGGPSHKLDEAFSLMVTVETQDEIDRYWDALVDGGEPSRCGWLTDKFGLTWQIVPEMLPGVLGGADADGRERATNAMLGMVKLDIQQLQDAYDGATVA